MKCLQCFFSDRAVPDETCRRCSRNLTRAEGVDLVILGLFYILLCRFSYYFFTGDYAAHLWRGGLSFTVSWTDAFVHPVNFAENPWHIYTVGWTFGLVLAVPVLTGVFYGPRWAAIIAAVGGYFVPVPFLFVLLALSAVMAGTRAGYLLRPLPALLASLVPSAFFLFAMTFRPIGLAGYLPWLVAAATAAALVSGAYFVARRRDYNARFLTWGLGVQGAAIFVMFYASVGFSKVEYEFLRREYWAEAPAFRFVVPPSVGGPVTAEDRARAIEEFNRRRAKALKEFSRFISWFPRSPETPMALFERAELYNMRPSFTGTRPDVLKAYTNRITSEALRDYETLREEFPTTLVAVEARLRAARYYLQHAQFETGVRELRYLIDFCDVDVTLDFRPAEGSVLLRWRSHRLSKGEEMQLLYEVLREARGDIRFIEQNTDNGRKPLVLYEQIDLHDPAAGDKILGILEWFPDCLLADNLRLALLEQGRWTLAQMKALYEQYPSGDAAPRMLLLLGSGSLEHDDAAAANLYLTRLVTDFPDTPEAAEAGKLLKSPAPAKGSE